jgi:hypothetical protein
MKNKPFCGQILLVTALVTAVCLGACGGPGADRSAGFTPGGNDAAKRDVGANQGWDAVRAVSWSVWRRRGMALKLYGAVPYCDDNSPKPYVSRVDRRINVNGVVLTMFVRFAKRRGVGCSWLKVGVVSDWIRRPLNMRLYDGSTTPPSRRMLH